MGHRLRGYGGVWGLLPREIHVQWQRERQLVSSVSVSFWSLANVGKTNFYTCFCPGLYLCFIFQSAAKYATVCVCVLRVGWADSARLLSPSPSTSSVPNPRTVAVVSLPCSEIFREILVIKRAHKYINSFERAAPQLLHSLLRLLPLLAPHLTVSQL